MKFKTGDKVKIDREKWEMVKKLKNHVGGQIAITQSDLEKYIFPGVFEIKNAINIGPKDFGWAYKFKCNKIMEYINDYWCWDERYLVFANRRPITVRDLL